MGCGSSSHASAAPAKSATLPTVLTQPGSVQKQEKDGRPISHFQIELLGQWTDYGEEEDKILKRAYMSGFPNAKFHLRGQNYMYDFKRMVQKNTGTGKERQIRPPMRMKPPAKPLVPEGPTMVIKVRKGQAGKKIKVPHPKDPSVNIIVVVPARAKTGQELLIPIPAIPAGEVASCDQKPVGWSTGAKVAAGGAAAALVVGGAILYTDEGAQEWVASAAGDVGEFVAPHAEAAGEWVAAAAVDVGEFVAPHAEAAGEWALGAGGDVGTWAEGAAEDIAEWAPDAAEDAGDWIVEAGDTAGAFVMDLFG